METPGLLVEILLLIAIAAAGVAIFERLRLPAIAGFLVMGALVGPGGLRLVDDPARVQSLAELGVVFLLFEIGLELPLERLRRLWRRALLAGGLQVAVTVACVSLGGVSLGLPFVPSLVMGGLIAMSSTALVLRLLTDRGEVDSPQGQLSVGILLFQDLCIVPMLLLVPLLAADDARSLGDAALALARSTLALVVFFAVARFALPRVLDHVARLGSRDLFSLLAFLVVIGSAVAAHEIGLTLAVGAFFGGLVLSTSPYAHQLFAEVVPLRGVLLGLFFTAVGMLLDVGSALVEWRAVLVYVSGVIALKALVVVAIVAVVLRQGLRLAIVTGFTVAQSGEFSFVLAAAAAGAGLLDAGLHQIFVAGSVGTLLATPFLVEAAPRFAAAIAGGGDAPIPAEDASAAAREDHAVLIGFGLAGQQLARVLRARDIPYVAVDANANSVLRAIARDEPVLYGDATRPPLLARLGLDRARIVVVSINDPLATRRVVRLVRRMAPRAAIVARTHYVLEVDELDEAGANHVVAEEFESTIELVAQVLRCFGMTEGSVARFTAELREAGYSPLRGEPSLILDPWLSELLEQVSNEWVEVPGGFGEARTLEDLDVRGRTGASVLAVDRGGRIATNPPASFSIRPDDRLLAIGSPEDIARLRALLADGA